MCYAIGGDERRVIHTRRIGSPMVKIVHIKVEKRKSDNRSEGLLHTASLYLKDWLRLLPCSEDIDMILCSKKVRIRPRNSAKEVEAKM